MDDQPHYVPPPPARDWLEQCVAAGEHYELHGDEPAALEEYITSLERIAGRLRALIDLGWINLDERALAGRPITMTEAEQAWDQLTGMLDDGGESVGLGEEEIA